MAKRKYAWGDGHGKVHSIPLKQHKVDVKALHALGGSTDLTAPPSGVQAYREARAAANAQYGPQVQAAQQLQTNVAPWFQDYMARVAGYATAAQNQAAPVLQQATGYQQGAAAQAPPGLDPNSQAGQQAAQAAAGRGALAQLGLDALNTNVGATQDYFKGLGATAAKELPQAQTAATQRVAQAKSQRGAALTDFLTAARQNAQNYEIARGTLNANVANSMSDATNAAAATAERARHDKRTEKNSAAATDFQRKQAQSQGYRPGGPGLNKYGYTADQWAALSPKAQANARAGKDKPTDAATQYQKDFYDKYGVKPASTAAVGNARDAIQSAKSTIKSILASNPKMTRQQLGPLLLSGQNAAKDDAKTKDVDESSSAVPKVKGLWATVALDLAFFNGVTRATADKLHRSGYSVKQLGLPSTSRTPRLGAAPLAPGANGQQRPT